MATVRERIQEFLASTNDADSNDQIEGGLLRNWVVVCDWIGTDGEKWMTHVHSEDAANWEVVGLLQSAADTYRNRVSQDWDGD